MKNLDSIIPISEEGIYPIRTVSEVSGVNAITLRAWERRYGLFKPKRTPKGHRLYSEKDIKRIQQVVALLDKGVSISRVAKALKQEVSSPDYPCLLPKKANSNDVIKLSKDQWKEYQEVLFAKINSYDNVQLESLHHELLSHFSIEVVSQNLISPVLITLKNRAKQLPSLSADYHFYYAFLSQRIGGLFLKTSIRNDGKKLLLMSIDNQHNEVELLLFAMPLLKHGYQIVVLGCNVSFDAVPMALKASNADGLLFYSDSDSSNQLNIDAYNSLVSGIKTPVYILGEHSEIQKRALVKSGLIILPDNCKQQISTIDKHLTN